MLKRLFTPTGELYGAILAGALLLVGFVTHTLMEVPRAEAFYWISLALGFFFGGQAAVDALRQNVFNIDVLMIVGAGLAAYIGHPEEGALLLFLFTFAGALEALAFARTRREVTALSALLPPSALVLRDGEWVEVDPAVLAVGERIKVRPGERVPTDAVVLLGATSMDQSAITGESMPREVKHGDELFAGTINVSDPVEASVLRPASESSVQKILHLVTQAGEQREPVQRTIDKLSGPFAMSVLAASVLVLLIWWLALERPLLGDDRQRGALYTAITFLIVCSPCALVIATPVATLAAVARAARGGVLFKGGQAIDALARVRSMCFDKTGTLTFGRPRLYETHPVGWSQGADLLAVAAALEQDSTHPIANAIREGARERTVAPVAMRDISHVTAQGIEGVLESSGARVRLGRYSFAEAFIPICLRARVQEILAKIQHRGHIGVVVAKQDPASPDGGEAAVLIMTDSIRPGAKEMVDALHAMGVRPLRMLTGDNRLTAQRVAEGLGLDQFDAELMPDEKLRIVGEEHRRARERAGGVGVIGDGVNDAPALAAADAGLSMGTIGTAAALESAQVVLLSDGLFCVPWAVRLARKSRAIVQFNLTLALGVIVFLAISTLAGSLLDRPLPLSLGVLGHEGGTVLVVLNSLRLLVFPLWTVEIQRHTPRIGGEIELAAAARPA